VEKKCIKKKRHMLRQLADPPYLSSTRASLKEILQSQTKIEFSG